MGSSDHAKLAKAYLEEICRSLDRKEKVVRRKEWWKTPFVVSTAVGLAMAACGGSVETLPGDEAEVCDNGVDDDGDERIDCADEDCAGFSGCNAGGSGGAYMAPMEECSNGIDDDYDQKVDCDDEDCVTDPYCTPAPYSAPFEVCDNGVDDDYDQKVDCDDEDCMDDPVCDINADYAAPF
jgi:hypothetical protein